MALLSSSVLLLSATIVCISCEALQCDRRGAVCGTDGRTYKTYCDLERARIDDPDLQILYPGRCSKVSKLSFYTALTDDARSPITDPLSRELRCSLIGQPVCGTDGTTYGNKCFLTVKAMRDPTLRFKHYGRCIVSNSANLALDYKLPQLNLRTGKGQSQIKIDIKNDSKNNNTINIGTKKCNNRNGKCKGKKRYLPNIDIKQSATNNNNIDIALRI